MKEESENMGNDLGFELADKQPSQKSFKDKLWKR